MCHKFLFILTVENETVKFVVSNQLALVLVRIGRDFKRDWRGTGGRDEGLVYLFVE